MGAKANTSRQRKRQWVLHAYGNGTEAPCAGCGEPLNIETLTLDRYPIPGRMGGTYRYENIRPMCKPCNNGHVDEPGYAEMVEHYRHLTHRMLIDA